jgi:hypothetical protein
MDAFHFVRILLETHPSGCNEIITICGKHKFPKPTGANTVHARSLGCCLEFGKIGWSQIGQPAFTLNQDYVQLWLTRDMLYQSEHSAHNQPKMPMTNDIIGTYINSVIM